MLCTSFTLFAQWNPNQALTFDQSIKLGKLSNGMSYAIQKNGYPANKANVSLYVKVGSAWEEAQEQGIAHFIEHMAFNGSKNFSKNDVVKYLESIGLTFGGDLNAETGFTHTHYKLEVPTDKGKAFDSSLMVLSDFAYYMSLNEDDINNERTIISNERNLRSHAMYKQLYFLVENLTKPSILASRLPIGDPKVIDTVSVATMRNFYKKWYQPQNFMLMVVGDVDVNTTEKLIQNYFNVNVPKTAIPKKAALDLDKVANNELVFFEHPDLQNKEVAIYFNPIQKIYKKTEGDYRRSMIRSMAQYILNQRFINSITTKATKYTSARLGAFDLGTNQYYPSLNITLSAATPKETIDEVFEEVGTWYEHGISADELKRYLDENNASLDAYQMNLDKIPSNYYLNDLIKWYSDSSIPLGFANRIQLEKRLMEQITVEEVNNEISKFDFNEFYVVVSGDKVDRTVYANLNNQIKTALSKKYQAKEKEALPTTLLTKNLPEGKILKETIVQPTTNVKLWELSNGLKVYTQKTDYSKEEFGFKAVRKTGLNEFPENKVFHGYMAVDFANIMGYGNFTPVQMNQFMAGKIAGVNVRFNLFSEIIEGNAAKKDMETLFQLIQLKTLYPKYDTVLSNNVLEKLAVQTKNVFNDPESYITDSAHKLKYNHNDYAGIAVLTPETLNKINVKESYDIYKDRMKSFEGFDFYFIGDFNEDSLKMYVSKYIASLPVSDRKVSQSSRKSFPVPKDQTVKLVKGKQEGTSYYGSLFGKGNFDIRTKTVAELLSSVLTQRIIEVMREEKQYVYSAGAGLGIQLIPDSRFELRYAFPTKEEYIDSVDKEFKILLDKVLQDGPTDAELLSAKNQLINRVNVQVKENPYWLDKMIEWGSYQYPYKSTEEQLKEINAVTKKDIQDLLQIVMKNSNHFKQILIPEKK